MMASTNNNKSGNAAAAVDMSTKVGGRVFHPALPVVDGSFPSNEVELGFQKSLEAYTADHIPLESVEGIQRRERVLNRMEALCRDWIRSVCIQKGLSKDVMENAGGQLFTSGSYRLSVHEPGADIDTILVAPKMCKREDFFGTNLSSAALTTAEDPFAATTVQTRDPNSLAERIRRHPDVTNFVPVEGAAVPLLTFDWEGVNIDLLFARHNSNSVSNDFDIDNDAVLDGADSATEKSLNGPRVTNLIAAFVAGTPARYQNFLAVVRCVRKWAKARGLYSNKMGYFGGVNINIGVALTIQLYPNACAASLLRKFFLVFKTWRWPQPVMLTKPHDAGYGLTVWSPHNAGGGGGAARHAVAPMITPAYPAMNSTLSISRQTLQILQEEFNRGHDIVDQLWKDYQRSPQQPPENVEWKKLFEKSDFFIAYPTYLSLCIVGPSQTEAQAWAGFVESRMRKLVSDFLGRSLPLKKIQLWPKKIEACVADRAALLTQVQRQNCITYFIGFHVDRFRMRGDALNIETALQNFREWELSRFQPLIPGMDVLVKTFRVKELPKICFQDIYEGGKQEAMKRRRKIRQEDPVRQEQKRVRKLEELKAKMAAMQRKKEEQEQQKLDRKRKREDGEEEEEDEDEKATTEENLTKMAQVKTELEEEATEEEDTKKAEASSTTETATTATAATTTVKTEPAVDTLDETNLLETALDTINPAEAGETKTRQQAEDDRRKLLAGEMMMAGAENDEDIVESDDEDAGYAGEGARQMIYNKKFSTKKSRAAKQHKDKRSLPMGEREAELLRKLGYAVVSDDECKVLGASMIPPWRYPEEKDEEPDSKTTTTNSKRPFISRIRFLEKFDVVELDAKGNVIDKGDDDFMPSKNWMGRKPGFEFKLGERGLGYYRTGKKVVVPSNLAY